MNAPRPLPFFCQFCVCEIPAENLFPDLGIALCRVCKAEQGLVPPDLSPRATGTVHCIECEAELKPESVYRQKAWAPCPRCERISDLDGLRVVEEDGELSAPLEAAPPEMLKIHTEPGAVRIVYRWNWLVGLALLLGSFAALAPALLFAEHAFSGELPSINLMLLLMVGFGLTLGYRGLGFLFNRTVIEARDGQLTSQTGPIPWRRNVRLSASDLQRVYPQRVFRLTQRNSIRLPVVYEVVALRMNRRREVLVAALEFPEDALAAARALREWLKNESDG